MKKSSHSCLLPRIFFFCFFFWIGIGPGVFAKPLQEGNPGEEDSVSQAQATLASLFGANKKMPAPPQMKGSIAVPGFDSKNIRIDETVVKEKRD